MASTLDPTARDAPHTLKSSSDERRDLAEETESTRLVGSSERANEAAIDAAFSDAFGREIRGTPPAATTARMSADRDVRNDGLHVAVS